MIAPAKSTGTRPSRRAVARDPQLRVVSCSGLPDHAPPAREVRGQHLLRIGIERRRRDPLEHRRQQARRGLARSTPAMLPTVRLLSRDQRREPKLLRASIVAVENQPAPTGQPPTFGGSNSSMPMLESGVFASSSEIPCQPTSLIARTTNSGGHEIAREPHRRIAEPRRARGCSERRAGSRCRSAGTPTQRRRRIADPARGLH